MDISEFDPTEGHIKKSIMQELSQYTIGATTIRPCNRQSKEKCFWIGQCPLGLCAWIFLPCALIVKKDPPPTPLFILVPHYI